MKLIASRIERDEDAIRLLLGLGGITEVEQAFDVVADLNGPRPIEPRVQYLLAELLEGT